MRNVVVLGLVGLAFAACAPAGPDSNATQDAAGMEPTDAPSAEAAAGDVADAATEDAVDLADAATSYAAVQTIFQERCSGYCHEGGGDVGASLALARPGARDALVNQPSREVPREMLVVPGRPDDSYLMQKVDGTFVGLPECRADAGVCGAVMPYHPGSADPVLPQELRDAMRRWILEGAPGPNGP
jgi:hypothetical protein